MTYILSAPSCGRCKCTMATLLGQWLHASNLCACRGSMVKAHLQEKRNAQSHKDLGEVGGGEKPFGHTHASVVTEIPTNLWRHIRNCWSVTSFGASFFLQSPLTNFEQYTVVLRRNMCAYRSFATVLLSARLMAPEEKKSLLSQLQFLALLLPYHGKHCPG